MKDPFDQKERAWLKEKWASGNGKGLNGYTPSRRTWDFKKTLQAITRPFKLIFQYPSAILGLTMITIMIAASIYAVVAYPRDQVVLMWNQEPTRWRSNPEKAMPVWVNWFRRNDFPETIIQSSIDGTAVKSVKPAGSGMNEITIDFKFDYPYGEFPNDLTVQLFPKFTEKRPLVIFNWIAPDGTATEFHKETAGTPVTYVASLDDRLTRVYDSQSPIKGLFGIPSMQYEKAAPGTYSLQLKAYVFEADSDLDAKMLLEGQVFGLAGTDHNRRDLMIPLLWGAPVALTFGLLGAIFTSTVTMLLAALGVWFGGWVDSLVHRLTEINMLLPTFPILIIMYIYYSKSVWIILGIAVLLSVFSSSIKTYRAVFLQVKEQPYIEAAQSYGAGSWRIILRYMLPRIIPVLVPQLVTLIPGYVFLEATLAYLNMSDPLLPTWGKMIQEGLANGALSGYYYWVLEPVTILLLTSFGFLMFGFTLERILNPRLREV
jgi:peptide/nickel transport system permease protein